MADLVTLTVVVAVGAGLWMVAERAPNIINDGSGLPGPLSFDTLWRSCHLIHYHICSGRLPIIATLLGLLPWLSLVVVWLLHIDHADVCVDQTTPMATKWWKFAASLAYFSDYSWFYWVFVAPLLCFWVGFWLYDIAGTSEWMALLHLVLIAAGTQMTKVWLFGGLCSTGFDTVLFAMLAYICLHNPRVYPQGLRNNPYARLLPFNIEVRWHTIILMLGLVWLPMLFRGSHHLWRVSQTAGGLLVGAILFCRSPDNLAQLWQNTTVKSLVVLGHVAVLCLSACQLPFALLKAPTFHALLTPEILTYRWWARNTHVWPHHSLLRFTVKQPEQQEPSEWSMCTLSVALFGVCAMPFVPLRHQWLWRVWAGFLAVTMMDAMSSPHYVCPSWGWAFCAASVISYLFWLPPFLHKAKTR